MPYTMYIVAATIADGVEDEDRLVRSAREKLGPDWTVGEGIPDAPAA